MLKPITYTCLLPAAHVSLHDSGQSWKAAGQCNFLQCDSNRLSRWNGVLRVIICDYSLKSQSTLAPKEALVIHGDWPTALAAPWRLPHSLYVYSGLDGLCFAAPGDCPGDLDDIGSRHQSGVLSPQNAGDKSISCQNL